MYKASDMIKQSFRIASIVKLVLVAMLFLPAAANHGPQENDVSSSSLELVMLKVHNDERKRLGSKSLLWDEALAQDAKGWASKLAASGRFEHAFDAIRKKNQGENLWMGTAGYFTYQQMSEMWLDERKMAKTGIFPDVTTTRNWSDVGHYTQMIWPATRKVGCAIGKGKSDDVLVCRYWPAGNRIGEKLQIDAGN